MIDSAVIWELSGPGAKLRCGPLEAFARCDHQGLDLIASRWNERAIPGISVLCSAGPIQSAGLLDVAERYVRGNDFIVSCKPGGDHRIAPQIYWRASCHPALNAARIELVLSAQTDLLDSGPTWRISSFVRESVLYHSTMKVEARFEDISRTVRVFDGSASTEHLFAFRIEPLDITYAQMVHPSDFASADVALDGTQPLILNATLFPDRLEKGVIRRGRICGWFMPTENDLGTAVQLAREFINEPLPLTT